MLTLRKGTDHHFRVRAHNEIKWSEWSAWATFKTLGDPPTTDFSDLEDCPVIKPPGTTNSFPED